MFVPCGTNLFGAVYASWRAFPSALLAGPRLPPGPYTRCLGLVFVLSVGFRGSAQLPVFGDRAVITDQAAVFLLSAVATVLPNGDHGETGRSNMPNICSIRLFRDSTSQNAKQHDRDCQRSLPRSWRNSGGGGGSVGQILF